LLSLLRIRGTGRLRASACLGLLCLLAAAGCRPETTLTYDVRVSRELPREVSVELHLQGIPRGGALTLRSYASPSDSRVVEVRALGAKGESLAVDATPETDRASARYSFAAPPSGMATVRYRVALAGRHGNANTGFEFRRKLVADERFALLRGRDLFLFPDRPEVVGGASISYALPPGWRAWSSWMPQGVGGVTVERRGRRALEEMLSAPLAFGAFEQNRLNIAGTEYRFLVEAGIPDGARAEITRDLVAATRAVAGWFDRSLSPEYVAFVLPRSALGDEIAGDAWGTAQGATLYPLTMERLRGFTRRLLDAHLQYPPRPLPFRDPSDRWFPLGLREFLSVEIVAGVRGIPEEIVDKYLAHTYAMLPAGAPQLLDLERAFTDSWATEETKQSAMGAVAPLAVRALERKVGGADAFRKWLRGASRQNSIGSIWSGLPLSASDRVRLQAAWARGGELLPVELAEEVSEIAATPASPELAKRPVARSLRVAITSQTLGYLENCGCKVNQSGGLARRSSLVKRLRSESIPLVLVDVGSGLADLQKSTQLDAFSFAEQRAHQTIVAGIGYSAMTPGRTDLGRGLSAFEMLRAGLQLPYVGANIERRDGSPFLPSSRMFEVGGIRCQVIGVTTPMNPFYRPSVLEETLDSLKIGDPVAAVRRVTANLPSTDFVIVSGEIPYRVIREIARSCPQVDLIIASPQMYLGELSPRNPSGSLQQDWSGFLGNTVVTYGDLGSYGVNGVKVDLAVDGSAVAASFERYELDGKVPDDPVVRATLDRFYQSLTPGAVSDAHLNSPATFWANRTTEWVGSAACANCHEAEAVQWRTTRHATAMRTLIKVHRDTQPRCVSCHVVGFGTPDGYRIGAGRSHLANVQCENCHGPGKAHAEQPSTTNIVRHVPEALCISCHDSDHSDAFVYLERLPFVVHDTSAKALAQRHSGLRANLDRP
jgi:hypothetical protein